jgi:hypothetical protein
VGGGHGQWVAGAVVRDDVGGWGGVASRWRRQQEGRGEREERESSGRLPETMV